jgi:hypothetical protein
MMGMSTVSNLERFKKDLATLIEQGELLSLAIEKECWPREFEKLLKQAYGRDVDELRKKIPSFSGSYQAWYSEAKVLVKQVLPDRFSDFVAHYERPPSRKTLTNETYRILDYLQGLSVTQTQGLETKTIVGPDAAVPQFRQQFAILKSVERRFESSLFDIRQLVQADLFDSDADAAEELAKNNFGRAAGAVAGVVLERHLAQVCQNHTIKITKKTPVTSDFNNALKDADVIDVPQWRFNQHLADIRNLCVHSKTPEPSREHVEELIRGVRKVMKTIY